LKQACSRAARIATIGAATVLGACSGGHHPTLARRGPAPRAPGDSAGSALVRGAPPSRSLVLMLDGVPWAVMDSLRRAGHFRAFARPSLVLSPFPSLTTVAFRDIWREPPTPGYEDRWFDPGQNRLRGGAWEVLTGHEASASFKRHVDVEGAALVSGLANVFPESLAGVELEELRAGILQGQREHADVVAYDCTTDAVAHLGGRAALVALLLRVEQLVDEVRRRDPDIRIDLLSDHGNDFVPSRQLPLDQALARAGLRLVNRLERPGDVVVPRFGLVGSVAFYASPSDRHTLVRALARAPGVDFVVWEEDGAVWVEGADGRARIEADTDLSRFSYSPETGDPLGLDYARARLHASGELDADAFAPDSSWLRESFATPYADALRRLVRAYRGEVRNPATVLVSLAPGGHFGDVVGDRITRMLGTHGSLRTTGSSAFYMSTHGPAPEVIRSDQLLGYLPESVQPRALHVAITRPRPHAAGQGTTRALARTIAAYAFAAYASSPVLP
jgi:hypothetical protein